MIATAEAFHTFANDQYLTFVNNLSISDRAFFAIGTWVMIITLFWGYNILLYGMYSFKILNNYLIQPHGQVDKPLIMKNIKESLFGHVLTVPIFSYFLYDVFVFCGSKIHAPIPSCGVIARDLFVSLASVDFFGYWIHRLSHHPSVYKHMHKKHHEYKVNVGVASIYSHPLEDFLNIITAISGSLMMGSHLVVVWLWLAIRILEAVNSHSGYQFFPAPFVHWFSGGEFHEYHHSHNVGNYGQFTSFWDYILGTDKAYYSYLEKKKEEAQGGKKRQ